MIPFKSIDGTNVPATGEVKDLETVMAKHYVRPRLESGTLSGTPSIELQTSFDGEYWYSSGTGYAFESGSPARYIRARVVSVAGTDVVLSVWIASV